MKRILLVQPSIEPPGGSRAVAAWILEALKDQGRVTLLTWKPPKLERVNQSFGTRLSPSDFDVRLGPQWVWSLARRLARPPTLFLDNMLDRECRRIGSEFDVVVTANNEGDLGGRGIQYVHFPKYRRARRRTVDRRWFHSAPLAAAYYLLANSLAGFSRDRMLANLTLVNSDFTGSRFAAEYGVVPLTLNPPALGAFPDLPWESREDGFVMIGRLSPEKRAERAIRILARVRERFPSVHLHIAGNGDGNGYAAAVRRLAAENFSWVFLHENLSRRELNELISRHRYGIHAMEEEHFGMAVAELVSGGCVPVVPRGGGAPEIIARDERLLYSSEDEAVDRIARILGDSALRAELRWLAAARKPLFTTERFVRRIREVAREFPSPAPLARPA